MAPFHAAKAAIREECLPHQDLYEPDFNTLLHASTMEMFPFFFFLICAWGDVSVSCLFKAWGHGLFCMRDLMYLLWCCGVKNALSYQLSFKLH